MSVDPATAAWTAEHDGRTFYFCSKGCMLDFIDDPEKFLAADYEPSEMETGSES